MNRNQASLQEKSSSFKISQQYVGLSTIPENWNICPDKTISKLEDNRTIIRLFKRKFAGKGEELRDLVNKGENQEIEFKRSGILNQTDKLAKEIVAMANAGGGKILIGINDASSIQGMDYDKEDEELIANISTDKIEPTIELDFNSVELGSDCVYVIKIR